MVAYQSFASVYDRMMADMPYAQWLAFTEEVLKRNHSGTSATIVDLGCGTGKCAIQLAKAGHSVTGIDLSESMLAIARQSEQAYITADSPSGKYISVDWKQQNMIEWTSVHQPDIVLSYCDSINYLIHEDDVLSLFYKTFEQLKDNGLFVFDCHPISRLEAYAAEQPFAYDDGEFSYIWFSDYDAEEAIIEHDITIYAKEQDGRYLRIDETHVQRAYSQRWLKQALLEVGFSQVSIYEDFTFDQASAQATRLFFIARK